MAMNIKALINNIQTFDIESFKIDELIAVLKACDDAYFNDVIPLISDDLYDTIKQYAQRLNPKHPYFATVGTATRLPPVKLPDPLGSLIQVEVGETADWVSKYQLMKEIFVVTDKLDGNSVSIYYDEKGAFKQAFTRGDGYEGTDVTRHLQHIPSLPKTVSVPNLKVRAEVIISENSFEHIKTQVTSRAGTQYKNARNMMSGVMTAHTNKDIVYRAVDVIGYEILGDHDYDKLVQLSMLKNNKFLVARHATFIGSEMTDEALAEHLEIQRESTQYAIDGVVIDVNSAKQRKRINPSRETLNPEYARKFKIADASNYAETTVVEVQWNISKDGYAKPKLLLEPVELVGVTVKHCTAFNAKFIKDNNIGPGAVIAITRSGDVIPFCQKVLTPAIAQMPEGLEQFHWTPTGVDLVLTDKMSNATVILEQLVDFFATLNTDALGEGNLRTLVDIGFTTPESIITMTKEEMNSVFGKAIGTKIYTGIRKSLTNIPQYKLMGAHPAFGRGIGVRRMKALYAAFNGDMTKCQDYDLVVSVESFKDKTATKVVSGYDSYVAFLDAIVGCYTFEQRTESSNELANVTIVFTGFRDNNLQTRLEQMGATFGSSVSKNTTIVVAADVNDTSTKLSKARSLGIPVVSRDNFDVEQLKEQYKNG